jgi:hypothetical protein
MFYYFKKNAANKMIAAFFLKNCIQKVYFLR